VNEAYLPGGWPEDTPINSGKPKKEGGASIVLADDFLKEEK